MNLKISVSEPRSPMFCHRVELNSWTSPGAPQISVLTTCQILVPKIKPDSVSGLLQPDEEGDQVQKLEGCR